MINGKLKKIKYLIKFIFKSVGILNTVYMYLKGNITIKQLYEYKLLK